MNQNLTHIKECIEKNLVVKTSLSHDIITLKLDNISTFKTIQFLKEDKNCTFSTLIDVFGVDNLGNTERFSVYYNLLSTKFNARILLETKLKENESIKSITSLYPVAEWFESEAYDMYGIIFDEHPNLTRILSDYGFQGHPLRKDFPTSGYTEKKYDEETKEIITQNVDLTQEYRDFDFLSPWEGTQYKETT